MNANITVLKDESLSGAGRVVEREYREVKRKASVDELVKVVDNTSSHRFSIGEIVRMSGSNQAQYLDKSDWWMVKDADYLALEPSDTLHINTPNGDGKAARFRMVDRKAAVGERVIVVSMLGGNSASGRYYKTGDIAKVKRIKDRGVLADLTENEDYRGGGQWNIDSVDYRVLEPVDAPTPAPLSAKPAPDQAAEIIAKLTGRVAALEKRVAALGTADVTDEDVAEISRIALDPPVSSGTAKLTRVKSPQEIRDDIVKRAKEDLADLRKFAGTKVPNDFVSFWPHTGRSTDYSPMHTVEYVVNRDKRTVVTIIRSDCRGHITRGIAKCAPGDVFNSHIGRAIALRRALGLEIPEEYVSAPQPTEIRVGDVVDETDRMERKGRVVDAVRPSGYSSSEEGLTFEGGGWAYICECKIIDDSRESDSAEPRKEVA
ncbi:hypothetical protein [Paenibacillus amylolyticus]|uniref:hypothetical protein n=1 Tax=Paenibacillus amylolyticus TaxID=1451 RepID=UPI003EBE195A